MTLGTSSSAAAVVAAARPSDAAGCPGETLHERPDLGALEALLADPAAVSSEEPAPAGLFTELPAQDETAADGNAPLESRLDDFAADSAPASPIHTPDAETSAVPMGHGTRGAEPATRDETALADAGEGDSSRADADPDASPAASAAGDIVEQDPSAEDTSAEGTSIVASPCTAEPETAADPFGCERGDWRRRGRRPGPGCCGRERRQRVLPGRGPPTGHRRDAIGLFRFDLFGRSQCDRSRGGTANPGFPSRG